MMSLHYLVKLEMFIAHVLPCSWCTKKHRNLSYRNCGLQIRQIWIPLITECGKYSNFSCKKYASLMYTNWNSDKERNGTSWFMSSLWQPLVSGVVDSYTSVMHVCTPSCNIFHTPIQHTATNTAGLTALQWKQSLSVWSLSGKLPWYCSAHGMWRRSPAVNLSIALSRHASGT